MSASLVRHAGRQPDVALVVRSPLLSPSARSFATRLLTRGMLLQNDEDLAYEQDIIRNLGSTKPWLGYIEYKLQHGSPREQAFVMERACIQLPRSYKLWKMVRIPILQVQVDAPSAEYRANG
jgi:hypothetical protein